MTFQSFEQKTSLFAARLQALTGWRRYAACFGSGAVLSLSMPPFNLFLLLWLCLPTLVWLLRGTLNKRQSFAVGWWFSFGFLTCSLYWIAASMFVDISHFWWAVPLAVAGLPAIFAIYYGLATMLAYKMGVERLSGCLALALCWFLADVARGFLFSGFPWNILGYAWSGNLPVLQLTSLIGVYGLSLLSTVAAATPAALTDCPKQGRLAVFLGLGFFLLTAIWGTVRLETTAVGITPNVHLRLVQPNVSQYQKWRNDSRARDFQSLLDLTSQAADPMPTHVIWPETASTYYLSEDDFHRKAIAAKIPAASAVLTGVIRRSLTPTGETTFFNSLVAVDGLGRLIAGYDKAHLVPFGEYMPLRKVLPLKALAAGDADFSSGPGARSIRVLGLPTFSPLICYESIFSGDVVDPDDRPDFLLNITNDAWYGKTIGPYQHFAIARLRAIEEGLPLVRVANTGISAVVDPLGRVIKRLNLGEMGIIDAELPLSLPLTFFSKWGDIPASVAALCLLGVFLILRVREKA